MRTALVAFAFHSFLRCCCFFLLCFTRSLSRYILPLHLDVSSIQPMFSLFVSHTHTVLVFNFESNTKMRPYNMHAWLSFECWQKERRHRAHNCGKLVKEIQCGDPIEIENVSQVYPYRTLYTFLLFCFSIFHIFPSFFEFYFCFILCRFFLSILELYTAESFQ